jgi:hypothetical protein
LTFWRRVTSAKLSCKMGYESQYDPFRGPTGGALSGLDFTKGKN